MAAILSDLIKLKVGQKFLYQGLEATVVWTEYFVEELGLYGDDKKKEMKYSRHFAFYYTFMRDGKLKDITHRSSYPYPDRLELKDYTLLK